MAETQASGSVEELLRNAWRALLEASTPGGGPLSLPQHQRMALRKTALFAQLEEVRVDWRELRAAIRPEEVSRYVNAAWTLKDLIAHMASWATEFRHEVETALRGGRFDYAIPYAMTVMGPKQWNEDTVEARRARPIDELLEEFETQTVRLQEILLEMSERDLMELRELPLAPTGDPNATWRGPSAFIIAAKCEHDRHHIAQIRKRLAAWSGL